ncbi:MAG: hypothetical protein HFJ25_05550 [Clostridia bacterium]|nr:hypothetical protein [Clostridia bacterium]
MGQKINPHAMRVGVIKNRNSRWYVDENHEKQNLKFSGYKIGEVKTWEIPKRTIWSRCIELWNSIKIAIFAITH